MKFRRTLKNSLILCCAALASASMLAQQKRPLVPEDAFRFKAVSDPQVSPDGKLVAYVVTTADLEKNKRVASVWIVPTDGSAEPKALISDIPARAPRWSPDGKWLAFVSNSAAPPDNPNAEQPPVKPATPAAESTPRARVWVVARDGSGRHRITKTTTGVSRYSWAPDGTKLAIVTKDGGAGKKPSDVKHYTTMVYKSDEAGWFDMANLNHVWVVDVKDGRAQQLTSGSNHDDSDPQWSPDGKSIAYVSEEAGPELREAFGSGDVLVVPATGGKPTVICEKHAYVATPRWSPDGTRLAYAAAPSADEQPLIFVANMSAPEKSQLASDTDLFPTDVEWNRAGIWFGTRERGTNPIYRIDPATRKAAKIAAGDRSLRSFSMTEEGGEIVYLSDEPTHPAEVFVSGADGKGERQLTFHNREILSQVELTPTERVSWKGADGLELEGFLKRPVNFSPSQKYPMILNLHGGPNGMWGFHWSFDEQLYASEGYAVFMPNPRGSSGYGMKFQRMVANEWGGKAYQDIIAGVEATVAKNPWIDGNKLGVTGVSYGGFMTDWIVTQTNMFKAAIPISGISDFISVEGTRDGAFGHSRDFGGDLFTAFDNYWKYSAIRYAARVKTPVLFLHGEVDNRVPASQAEEYFRAIKHFGGTADLVLFPRENHGLSGSAEPKHLLETYKWKRYWFDRWVKGDLQAKAPDAAPERSAAKSAAGEQ